MRPHCTDVRPPTNVRPHSTGVRPHCTDARPPHTDVSPHCTDVTPPLPLHTDARPLHTGVRPHHTDVRTHRPDVASLHTGSAQLQYTPYSCHIPLQLPYPPTAAVPLHLDVTPLPTAMSPPSLSLLARTSPCPGPARLSHPGVSRRYTHGARGPPRPSGLVLPLLCTSGGWQNESVPRTTPGARRDGVWRRQEPLSLPVEG